MAAMLSQPQCVNYQSTHTNRCSWLYLHNTVKEVDFDHAVPYSVAIIVRYRPITPYVTHIKKMHISGAVSRGIGIPIIKVIFIMKIPILATRHLRFETPSNLKCILRRVLHRKMVMNHVAKPLAVFHRGVILSSFIQMCFCTSHREDSNNPGTEYTRYLLRECFSATSTRVGILQKCKYILSLTDIYSLRDIDIVSSNSSRNTTACMSCC